MAQMMEEGLLAARLGGEKEVILKAMQDDGFRARLMASPRQAIKEQFGVELTPDVDIDVIEETPGKATLVLPYPHRSGDELSDWELDMVAGGGAKKSKH